MIIYGQRTFLQRLMLVLRSVGKLFASSVLFLFFMLFRCLNFEILGIGILGIDFPPASFHDVHALKDFDW